MQQRKLDLHMLSVDRLNVAGFVHPAIAHYVIEVRKGVAGWMCKCPVFVLRGAQGHNLMYNVGITESINHRIGINAPAHDIYEALTTDKGLASWWTNDVTGAGGVGSIIQFRFGGGGPDFEVAELVAGKTVKWSHSGDVPEAWMGTQIVFSLEETEKQVFLNFTHSGWKEASDLMAHCNTKWAVFLLSLKDAFETGKGKPFPDEVQLIIHKSAVSRQYNRRVGNIYAK